MMPDPRITDYAAESRMAPHAHDEMSLIVVLRGAYEERLGRSAATHEVGSMLLYPAFAEHSQRFGARGARKLVFTPAAETQEYLRGAGVSLTAPRVVQGPHLPSLARRVAAELATPGAFTALAVEGLLLELVAAFGAAAGTAGGERGRPPRWLRTACEAIRDGDGLVSLASLAAAAQRHPVHVARAFRRHLGQSVGSYARHVRLERAQALLLTAMPLTELAFRCGFSSHSHFSRAFRAAFGMTPSEFRGRSRGPS